MAKLVELVDINNRPIWINPLQVRSVQGHPSSGATIMYSHTQGDIFVHVSNHALDVVESINRGLA
ncbi:hypothetical protein [Phenylobacterium sp.]|uniref:hypothetical protein n=1 Tax=Phenylobacterium sp. TaxID=1871053 RepID=UPI0035B3049D